MPHDFFDKNKKPLSSSGGGYKPLHNEEPLRKPSVREETVRERAARQRRERQAELTFTQEDYDRWARNRERVIAERQQVTFELGWMQSPVTQSQDELWESLFTSETTEEQKQTIKQCNVHLNDPVRQGEIVLLPTTKPQTPEEQSLLDKWLEEAKIASAELAKLLDEEVATLHRHFELFSHQLEERIRTDGLPTDFYAQVGTGVGATAALVEQNLKNIQNVLLEINNLYVSQVAMASRTGGMGMNYGAFVADRAELFKKLDGSFAMLSKRSVQLPVYTQIKRNLKLSTKSVIHNADEILKTGFVKELGKRIANIAKGISAARGLGYVGLVVGAASGMSSIYEACKVDGTGDCGKTTTREIGGFIGGVIGGIQGGNAGVGLAVAAVSGIAFIIGVSASAPVLAIAAIGGAVAGGLVGGVAGSAASKWFVDEMYAWGA
ncbi:MULTISPECIES: hypothetical protein [Vibrio harveyi group]|uniref:hypothetical protein n=1 Tax=Vibrio harveyi group TaxID=717610 RepID=UPI001D1632CA|nr:MULTISPECIES: hypothetical protein [Vibrio harveyi group]MDA0385557.1 hypothetical protein [Vibrio owensii]